jgi:hypothetical protein
MINLNSIQDDLKEIVELDKIGIVGETHSYNIYAGQYHIKNIKLFNFIKWGGKICSIILIGYIIYKIVL